MKEQDCLSYGFIEKEGKVVYRDMLLRRGQDIFAIKVGLPEFIEEVRRRNQSLAEHLKEDDQIFAFEDLEDPESICKRLRSLPEELLQPYLSPQENQD